MPAPLAVLDFPRLVDLPPDGAAVQRLRQVEGDLIVLSRLYPRAAYWLLRAHGIDGRFCGRRGSHPLGVAAIHPLPRPPLFPDAAAIARSISAGLGASPIFTAPTFQTKTRHSSRSKMKGPVCRDGIR